MTLSAPATLVDRYLTIREARDELEALNIARYTVHQVERMANTRRLPFFEGPNGQLIIGRATMIAWFADRQAEALRAAAPPRRVPARYVNRR